MDAVGKNTPLQCVTFDGEEMKFNTPLVKSLLQQVEQEELCVISIAGLARSGKSFLLSLLTNYLDFVHQNGTDEFWEIDSGKPIEGFNWAKGKQKVVTKGIWMLLHPHPVEGKRLLLLDCQGTGDQEQSTAKLDSMVVYYGLALSSLQIMNVRGKLNPNNLDSLVACMLSNEDGKEKHVYENLKFLIRDWPDDDEPQQLQEMIQTTKSELMKKIGTTILRGFEKTSVFALPHPGSRVTKSSELDKLTCNNVEPDFLLACKNLFHELRAMVGLQTQQKLTGNDFFHKFGMLGLRSVGGIKPPLEARMTALVGEAFNDTEKYFMAKASKAFEAMKCGVWDAKEILGASESHLRNDERMVRYATNQQLSENITLLNHLADEAQHTATLMSTMAQLKVKVTAMNKKEDEAAKHAIELQAKIKSYEGTNKDKNRRAAEISLREYKEQSSTAMMELEKAVEQRAALLKSEKERRGKLRSFSTEWMVRMRISAFVHAMFKEAGFVDPEQFLQTLNE